MSTLPIILITSSIAILGIGIALIRHTTHRSFLINTMFTSMALLFAAYQAVARTRPDWIFVLPFLSGMLFIGRTFGVCWRSRKEPELVPIAKLLSIASAFSITSIIAAYFLQ